MPTGRMFVETMIQAPREKVFEAWTNSKSVSQWMRPKGVSSAKAELDVRVGGKLRILTNGADGVREYTGEYREIDAPSKLVFTWLSHDTDAQPTEVTVELSEDELEPGCHLALSHAGFVSPAAMQHYGAAWNVMLEKLAMFEKVKRKRRKAAARSPSK
jgi:glutathione S-transferase